MWFKKQKTYTINPPTALGCSSNLTLKLVEGFEAPVEQINAWIRFGNIINRANEVANRVAGEQLRKQAAEIEGLTREVEDRREWGAKIKEEYDALAKRQAQDAHDVESLTVCLDSLGLILEHRDAELNKLTDELVELRGEIEKDDDLFDEAADEIERLNGELDKLSELYDNARVEIVSAEGQIGHLEAELAKKRKCACKAKKSKAK